MDAAFEGAGQSFEAGLTSTGAKGFVSFQGTEYSVTDDVFQQFKTGYEQAQKESSSEGDQLAGHARHRPAQVADRRQERRRGEGRRHRHDQDHGQRSTWPSSLDDVNQALEKVRGLGVEGSEDLPEKLTEEQKKQAADAIKDLNVEIYTGKDDSTLRRIVVNMAVEAGGRRATASRAR